MHLANHHVLSSQNLNELRETLDELFIPHELNITQRDCEVDASINACAIGDLSLVNLSYGKGVPIEVSLHEDQCADIIILNIPNSGKGRFERDGESWDISPEKGLVFDMQRSFVANTHGYNALTLSFSIETLKQHARSLIGDKIDLIDFKFERSIDMTTPAGQSLRNAITHAAQEMNGPMVTLNNPIAIASLENYLLTQFIALQPNTFMALQQNTIAPAIMHRHIKRARDYIHDYAYEKITLQDLSSHAGCSYRSLQNAFNEIFGMSPMAYLKTVRLKCVREELLAANNEKSSVSDIAKKWGFTHMGRLAELYKKQYGILPSDTLRQKK